MAFLPIHLARLVKATNALVFIEKNESRGQLRTSLTHNVPHPQPSTAQHQQTLLSTSLHYSRVTSKGFSLLYRCGQQDTNAYKLSPSQIWSVLARIKHTNHSPQMLEYKQDIQTPPHSRASTKSHCAHPPLPSDNPPRTILRQDRHRAQFWKNQVRSWERSEQAPRGTIKGAPLNFEPPAEPGIRPEPNGEGIKMKFRLTESRSLRCCQNKPSASCCWKLEGRRDTVC